MVDELSRLDHRVDVLDGDERPRRRRKHAAQPGQFQRRNHRASSATGIGISAASALCCRRAAAALRVLDVPATASVNVVITCVRTLRRRIVVRQQRGRARAGKRDGDRGPQRRRRPGKDWYDPIGQQDRLVHVVGDHHGRDAAVTIPAQPRELALQRFPRERIECAERLVEKHDLRIRRQRPGDRHTLAHAARQLARATGERVAQSDALERLLRPGALLVAR